MQTDKDIQVLETYVHIRDGIAPASNVGVMRDALKRYRTSFFAVKNDESRNWSASKNCMRFKNLYDTIGNQLVLYYGLLLNSDALSRSEKENIAGRLYTLKLFEVALFSLALRNNEGGISMIDPLQNEYCKVDGRQQWLNAMSIAHQDLQRLHETVFGYRSATSFNNAMDIVRRLDTNIEHRKRIEGIAYKIADFGVWMLAWFKVAAPLIRRARASVDSPTLRVVISLVGGAVYALGLTKLDSEASRHFSFLQPRPSIDRGSLMQWNELISHGEQVVNSKLDSTQLYFAYLKLIALLDRETAYDFLMENQVLLSQMENQYGSIDAALNHLKEERENETNNKRAG